MRTDYHRAIKALRTAATALEAVELAPGSDDVAPGGAFLNAVRRAASALFDVPLAAAVIDQEEIRRARPLPEASAACDSFMASIRPNFAMIYDRTIEIKQHWALNPGNSPDAWSKLVPEAAWLGKSVQRNAIFDGLRRQLWTTGFTLDDLKTTVDILVAISHTIDIPAVAAAAKRVDLGTPLQTRIATLLERVNGAIQMIDVAEQSWRHESTDSLQYLRSLHRRLHELSTHGLQFPVATDDSFLDLLSPASCTAVRDHLLQALQLVIAELEAGPLKGYAIIRLRVYLERFAREKLLADIAAGGAQHGAKPSRKAEARVQAEVDRFLFLEGFFPITHAVAGRGRLDTFIEQNRHIFEDRGLDAQSPILLELKQAISAGTTTSTTKQAVVDAVADALAQADQYRQHLGSNFKWLDSDVFAVVVYDGPVRYSSADPAVLLVYLGTAVPSDGVDPL